MKKITYMFSELNKLFPIWGAFQCAHLKFHVHNNGYIVDLVVAEQKPFKLDKKYGLF